MFIHHYKEATGPYWVAAFESGFHPDLQDEIFDFCCTNFGPGLGEFRVDNSPFVHRWINNIKYGEVKFSREEDLMFFVLRWG